MKRLRRSRRMAVLTIVILGALGGGASAYFTATGAGTASALVGTWSSPSSVIAAPISGGATVTRDAPSADTDAKAPGVTPPSPVDASEMATTPPTINGATGNATANSSTATVQSRDGAGTDGTVDQAPSVTGDETGHQAGLAATAPSDPTKPALRTLEMFDSDANGRIDEVKATFSEALATSSATEPWTLTNVPGGGILGAVSTSGSRATLTINEGNGAADTSVGSFKVALAASPSAIRDSAGNEAGFVATAPGDLAGPVLMSATSDSGTTTNLMQDGDTLALTFSEALAASSVPASPDATESRSASTGLLTIPGLITPTTLDLAYLDKSSDSATSSTTSALTGKTVTATLGPLTTNGTVAAGSGGARIFPAASLKDAAGNAAASAAPATARLVSPLF